MSTGSIVMPVARVVEPVITRGRALPACGIASRVLVDSSLAPRARLSRAACACADGQVCLCICGGTCVCVCICSACARGDGTRDSSACTCGTSPCTERTAARGPAVAWRDDAEAPEGAEGWFEGRRFVVQTLPNTFEWIEGSPCEVPGAGEVTGRTQEGEAKAPITSGTTQRLSCTSSYTQKIGETWLEALCTFEHAMALSLWCHLRRGRFAEPWARFRPRWRAWWRLAAPEWTRTWRARLGVGLASELCAGELLAFRAAHVVRLKEDLLFAMPEGLDALWALARALYPASRVRLKLYYLLQVQYINKALTMMAAWKYDALLVRKHVGDFIQMAEEDDPWQDDNSE